MRGCVDLTTVGKPAKTNKDPKMTIDEMLLTKIRGYKCILVKYVMFTTGDLNL